MGCVAMTCRVLVLVVALVGCIQAEDKYWDYVVIGAGPGGLQMGHFLQKAGRDYVVIERNSVAGKWAYHVLYYTLWCIRRTVVLIG